MIGILYSLIVPSDSLFRKLIEIENPRAGIFFCVLSYLHLNFRHQNQKIQYYSLKAEAPKIINVSAYIMEKGGLLYEYRMEESTATATAAAADPIGEMDVTSPQMEGAKTFADHGTAWSGMDDYFPLHSDVRHFDCFQTF